MRHRPRAAEDSRRAQRRRSLVRSAAVHRGARWCDRLGSWDQKIRFALVPRGVSATGRLPTRPTLRIHLCAASGFDFRHRRHTCETRHPFETSKGLCGARIMEKTPSGNTQTSGVPDELSALAQSETSEKPTVPDWRRGRFFGGLIRTPICPRLVSVRKHGEERLRSSGLSDPQLAQARSSAVGNPRKVECRNSFEGSPALAGK